MKVTFKYIGLLILIVVVGTLYKTNKSLNKSCNGCNIMLIDIDLLRADALPCFGYSRNTAPNICALAKKSVLFKDNYSTAPWTLPGIFSTITSLYPTFHGMRALCTDKLSPNLPTLAEVLQKKGYQTVFVGDNNESGLLSQKNGGWRGYDRVILDQPIEQVVADLEKSSKPWFVYYYRGDLHMPYLIPKNEKPMENIAAPKKIAITNSDYDRLLNIYLKKHYIEVFKQKTIDEYGSIILGQDKFDDTSVTKLFYDLSGVKQEDYLIDVWKPMFNTYMETFDKNNPSDVAYVRMMYDTKVKLTDNNLEKLLQKLDSGSLANNTITAITSDHGEAFGEHGTFSHDNNYYAELFLTPLIIRSPRLSEKQIEQPTSNVDIFPTLLEMAGIEQPSGLQGYSLMPYINGQNKISRPFILSEVGLEGIVLQNSSWLYFLANDTSAVEQSKLYNKIIDPTQNNDVATQYPELVRSLYKQAILLRSYNQLIVPETKKYPDIDGIKLSPQKIKRLQEEGYF